MYFAILSQLTLETFFFWGGRGVYIKFKIWRYDFKIDQALYLFSTEHCPQISYKKGKKAQMPHKPGRTEGQQPVNSHGHQPGHCRRQVNTPTPTRAAIFED